MTWTRFVDSAGQTWDVNQFGLYGLLRASLRAEIILRRSRITETDNGFLMPMTFQCETDWAGFRTEVDERTATFYASAEAKLQQGGETMRQNLLGMISSGRAAFTSFDGMRRTANSRSRRSIDGNVENWETALGVAQFVRDTSATILVAGAGVMSGGAAFAALGAGSVLRGTATYQDTGNVGAAVINGTSTFVVGAVGIGGGGAQGISQQLTVISVGAGLQGGFQGIQSMTEGASGTEALQQAGLAAGFSAIGGLTGLRTATMSVPVRIGVSGLVDTLGNRAVAGVRPPPAQPPWRTVLERPLATGNVDYFDIPILGGEGVDEAYLTRTALRRVLLPGPAG